MMPSAIFALATAEPSEATVIVLVCLLPLTVLLSGFFSGSETALFSLDAAQRLDMRRTGGRGSRQALVLLQQPRMLLITILLGNMTANVSYFVISSALLMWWTTGWFLTLLAAIGSLLIMVLVGEILPKMVASASPPRLAAAAAPLLIVIHRIIAPLRIVVDTVIITPMSRLTGADSSEDELTAQELERLLALSSSSGVVDREEQQILSDVLHLSRVTVRKAMTPRTRTVTVQVDDPPGEILKVIERHRFTRIPVHGEDLDDIVGILPTKAWLRSGADTPLREILEPATFVPEVTTLERALEVFRGDGLVFAIVLDEYGGTAGVIGLQDIVEELIGDIAGPATAFSNPPRPLGPGRWVVDGDTSIRHLAEIMRPFRGTTRAATLGGLITETLGRLPQSDDQIDFEGLRLTVHHAEQGHAVSVIVSLLDEEASS